MGIINFFMNVSFVLLKISIIFAIIAIPLTITALLMNNKGVNFYTFKKRVSLFGVYFGHKWFCELALLVNFGFLILLLINCDILEDKFGIFWGIVVYFIICTIYANLISLLIKSLYYIFKSKKEIYSIYIQAIYSDNDEIKKLIDINLEEHKATILKDNLKYIIYETNSLDLISEQIIFLYELYDYIPYEKKSEKLKEYIESFFELADSIIDIELGNDEDDKNREIEHFNKELDSKLDVLIRHNREFKEVLSKK